MVNRWIKIEAVTDFIFLGFKITADGHCSHEIKRCLILGRKAMTKLDRILKEKTNEKNTHRTGYILRWKMLTYCCFAYHFGSGSRDGCFAMSRLFATGGQGIGALASNNSFNKYSGLISFTGLILQSKELSRVFSSTTI